MRKPLQLISRACRFTYIQLCGRLLCKLSSSFVIVLALSSHRHGQVRNGVTRNEQSVLLRHKLAQSRAKRSRHPFAYEHYAAQGPCAVRPRAHPHIPSTTCRPGRVVSTFPDRPPQHHRKALPPASSGVAKLSHFRPVPAWRAPRCSGCARLEPRSPVDSPTRTGPGQHTVTVLCRCPLVPELSSCPCA